MITNVPAADALNTYTAPITIGSGRSAQSCASTHRDPPDRADDLLIDTGSSYTWVGSDKRYVKTSDARDTGRTFTIRYGSGTAEGEHYTANLQFTGFSGSTMKNQGFGVASSSSGFGNVDGILGIGPTSLSSGTVSGLGQIPTVIDTLKRQGRIPNAIVAASFTPNTRGDTENRGSLALGGTDPSKFNAGTLVYTSKVDSNPYWGAKINKFTYSTSRSTQTLGAANPIGIVDTGACSSCATSLTRRHYAHAPARRRVQGVHGLDPGRLHRVGHGSDDGTTLVLRQHGQLDLLLGEQAGALALVSHADRPVCPHPRRAAHAAGAWPAV